MKVLVTGTHFTPAQAVINELLKDPNNKILYIGRKFTREGDKTCSVESLVLPKLGVKFIPIITGRLQRSFTIYTIPSLLKMPIGFIQSLWILAREKPDIVLSFGGYIGVPVVISAWFLSIPVILHEQTLVSWFANKVAVSFPENMDYPQNKVVLTGNPIRGELLRNSDHASPDVKKIIERAKKDHLSLLFITGGNQGSHTINQVAGECLVNLTKICCIIHQTGDSKFNDFDKLVKLGSGLEDMDRYLAKKWLDVEDVSFILRNVDLAVSRAGVNTLQELTYFSVPTIVIPIKGHYEQLKNARYFSNLGITQTLPQTTLNKEKLLKFVTDALENISQLKQQSQNAKGIIIPDAAKRVSLEVWLIYKQFHGV